jgi:hypothetical protein
VKLIPSFEDKIKPCQNSSLYRSQKQDIPMMRLIFSFGKFLGILVFARAGNYFKTALYLFF